MMKKQIGSPLFALMALMLVELSCISGTPSPQTPTPFAPTQAEVINLEPVPTQAQAATAVPPLAPEKFIIEQFDGDLRNWSYFSGKNDPDADDSGARPLTEDGFLVFDIARNLDVYAVYEPADYENVQIDVSVENRGASDHTVNLVCRLTDRGWYEVSIKNNGFFWIFACDFGRGACVTLADGASSKVNLGKATNEYSFVCQDRLLKLVTNGSEAGSFIDNHFVYPSGKIGVGLSSFNDSPNRVRFDWVKVSQP
jgi:hypothetical protein